MLSTPKVVNLRGVGIGIILKSPSEDQVHSKSVRLNFPISNNQAEYEFLIQGLIWVAEVGIKSLLIYSDWQVVVRQLNEDYVVNSENLKKYMEKASRLKNSFEYFQLEKIYRQKN